MRKSHRTAAPSREMYVWLNFSRFVLIKIHIYFCQDVFDLSCVEKSW